MNSTTCFTTFRSLDRVLAQLIDYYYIDYKPINKITIFECFPHFNNTVSLYASHCMPAVDQVEYNAAAPPLQLFTPLRNNVLRITQIGPVHRVVIVFNLLSVQQFWPQFEFAGFCENDSLFSTQELNQLFSTVEVNTIRTLLDSYLLKRYVPRPPDMVSQMIQYVFDHLHSFSVTQMASSLGMSRRHLQRRFKATIGVRIKEFHQIVMFRRAIEYKHSNDNAASLTELAYRAKYFDQAHMIRTFRKFTSHAPRRFFDKGQQLGQADIFWHLIK